MTGRPPLLYFNGDCMLLDIGAIVGFYALARLVPSGKLSRALSAVAAIVTLIALADLSSHVDCKSRIVAHQSDSGEH